MSQPAVSNTLWPPADQMKRYLDSWAMYAGELENTVRSLEDRLRKLERSSALTEAALRKDVQTISAPLQAQVFELEEALLHSRREVQDLRAAEETYRRMLGEMLGMNPGPGSATLTLLNDLSVLVEESKRQFRGSL